MEVLEIGTLEVISITPERDPGLIFTKHLADRSAKNYNHIVVALGCINAGFDLAMTAIESSITRAVHIFNGMNGIASPPSSLEAVLSNDKIHTELIFDGHHVEPIWGKTLIDIQRPSGVGLVSDCLELAGVPEER